MRTGQSSKGLCGSPEASIFSVIVPVWFSDICDAWAQNPSFQRRFLVIELDTQIGERGFRVCNSSIHLVSVNLP